MQNPKLEALKKNRKGAQKQDPIITRVQISKMQPKQEPWKTLL